MRLPKVGEIWTFQNRDDWRIDEIDEANDATVISAVHLSNSSLNIKDYQRQPYGLKYFTKDNNDWWEVKVNQERPLPEENDVREVIEV